MGPESSANGLCRLCRAGRCRLGARRQLFLDAGRLAAALTQVVQLGTAQIATALDLDAGDQRAVGLERALHAFAAGDLAHGKTAVQAAIALGDHHALVSLHALAAAFDHIHIHDDGVAGAEVGNGLVQAGDFFRFQGLDQVHLASNDVVRAKVATSGLTYQGLTRVLQAKPQGETAGQRIEKPASISLFQTAAGWRAGQRAKGKGLRRAASANGPWRQARDAVTSQFLSERTPCTPEYRHTPAPTPTSAPTSAFLRASRRRGRPVRAPPYPPRPLAARSRTGPGCAFAPQEARRAPQVLCGQMTQASA